jgi:hypothetical protein
MMMPRTRGHHPRHVIQSSLSTSAATVDEGLRDGKPRYRSLWQPEDQQRHPQQQPLHAVKRTRSTYQLGRYCLDSHSFVEFVLFSLNSLAARVTVSDSRVPERVSEPKQGKRLPALRSAVEQRCSGTQPVGFCYNVETRYKLLVLSFVKADLHSRLPPVRGSAVVCLPVFVCRVFFCLLMFRPPILSLLLITLSFHLYAAPVFSV